MEPTSPVSPAWQEGSLLAEPQGRPRGVLCNCPALLLNCPARLFFHGSLSVAAHPSAPRMDTFPSGELAWSPRAWWPAPWWSCTCYCHMVLIACSCEHLLQAGPASWLGAAWGRLCPVLSGPNYAWPRRSCWAQGEEPLSRRNTALLRSSFHSAPSLACPSLPSLSTILTWVFSLLLCRLLSPLPLSVLLPCSLPLPPFPFLHSLLPTLLPCSLKEPLHFPLPPTLLTHLLSCSLPSTFLLPSDFSPSPSDFQFGPSSVSDDFGEISECYGLALSSTLEESYFRSHHNKGNACETHQVLKRVQVKGDRQIHQSPMGRRLAENQRWEKDHQEQIPIFAYLFFNLGLLAPSLFSVKFQMPRSGCYIQAQAAGGSTRQG